VDSFRDSEIFRELLDYVSDGVYFVDPSRRIKYWNKSAENITGYSAEEVTGISCADDILVHVNDEGVSLCQGECPLAATMKDGCVRCNVVYLRHKDGHRIPVQVSTAALKDGNGTVVGGLETFSDHTTVMSALQEAAELKEIALLCPLTGIGNRRYCDRMLEQRLNERKRNHTTLGVLLFDVDHFKLVNDNYGHPVGDIVLKMVAKTLMHGLRTYDFLGRWGGEEFLILLPNVVPAETVKTANRLRSLVKQSASKISQQHLQVTVSCGATNAYSDDTPETIFTRVDKLLYESKANGRNRVTFGS
jgi:diguanylate cyclase (GGDEF)-like protein/PAS domain S-box-containing protein